MADRFDEELRRRARAARAEVAAGVDAAADLTALPPDDAVDPITNVPSSRRGLAVAGAIAAVAVAVVGGVVLLDRDDAIEIADEPSGSTTSSPGTATTTTAGATTVPAPATIQPATTVAAATTTSTAMVPPPGVPDDAHVVSYADPPPVVNLRSIGSVATLPPGGWRSVAVGDLGVAVSTAAELTVIGFDGAVRTFDDVDVGGLLAYGPGDVVYTTTGTFVDGDFAVSAVALSGDRAGTVIASEPADVNRYLEYPPSSFGHGARGVSMRRDHGEVAIEYVDVDGEPTVLDPPPAFYDTEERGLMWDEPVGDVFASTGTSWTLAIDHHPDRAETFEGPSPPAPTVNGDGAFWTHIGPDLAPDIDFGQPSHWVVAQLGADGSATWWSLPNGWSIAASDVWGTVAVRQQGNVLDLALVEFVPALDEPPDDDTVDWRTLPWEFSGVRAPCADCTQLLHDGGGTPVTLDPMTGVLTRHDRPEVSVGIDAGDLDPVFRPRLVSIGPDGVVYLSVRSDARRDEYDLARDLVAVSLGAGDAGREIRRWSGVVDGTGDTELVASRDGLVPVGCCAFDVERPRPDAPVVVPWVDASGDPTTLDGPVMRVEIDFPTFTVHRDDDLPAGTRSWTFEPEWEPRGMPSVMPTLDGGFIALVDNGRTEVARGWADGTVEMVILDRSATDAVLDPAGRLLIPDGDWYARVAPFGDFGDRWGGRAEVADDGTVSLPDIDVAIDSGVDWAWNPVAFAHAVAGSPQVNETRTVAATRTGDDTWTATVTTSNLFDDSVAAVRFELDLERDPDGRFRFVAGRWTQSCQPNRGHQDFSTELCR